MTPTLHRGQTEARGRSAASAAPATTTANTVASSAFRDILLAEDAMIYVAEEGTVAGDYGYGQVSGFLISSDGLALVPSVEITGAESHLVWVGDADEPVPAEFIAADECLDLALIDLEGGGYSFLELGDARIELGDTVFGPAWSSSRARYELIQGVVESVDHPGVTASLSVPIMTLYQTEEDTDFGPVVDRNGELVGLAAGWLLTEGSDSSQGMIPLDGVLPGIDGLLDGENGAWVGLSNWASGPYWMWLSGIRIGGVHPASPAAATGIEADDVILDLSGQALAVDGTKRAYCEILRASDPDEPMPVTVYREATGDLLTGEINGDSLAVIGTLDDYVAPVPTLADGDVTHDLIGRPVAVGWTALTSPDGSVRIEVPSSWETESDSDGGSAVLRAAPNLTRFNLDRGDYPVGGGVIGATIAVHEIGDTVDAAYGDLLDVAEEWFGDYDDDQPCTYGFLSRRPFPSRTLPDYWAIQYWYCDDDLRIREIVGITQADPGLAIVTTMVYHADDSEIYEWIAWSAQNPDAPNVAPGWRRHILPDESLSIGIPPGWKAVNESTDPNAEGASLLTGDILLAAFEGELGLSGNEAAFVLLNRAPLDERLLTTSLALDADWLAETTLPSLEALDNLSGDVSYEIVTLPYGEAVRFEYELELGSSGGGATMPLVQYAWLVPGGIVALTFGLLVDDPAAYDETMATMAASFAIPENSGVGVAGTQQSTVEKDSEGRPLALEWQEVVTEFGNFAFEMPEDWELEILSVEGTQLTRGAPDMDAFKADFSDERSVGTTGTVFLAGTAGNTSDLSDAGLADIARMQLFDRSDLEGCDPPNSASAFETAGAIPDLWVVDIYDCDDGYVLIDGVGITRSETAHRFIFSIQATSDEMQLLTWIPDSVRRKVVQGVGPDEDNLADPDPESQVLLVGESSRFAVVIPVEMERDTWFLVREEEDSRVEAFTISPELGPFRDDWFADPPAPASPGWRSPSSIPKPSLGWTRKNYCSGCNSFSRNTGSRRAASN